MIYLVLFVLVGAVPVERAADPVLREENDGAD
jgi:hypothetical protein